MIPRPDFKPARQQDASAVIRGFHYQVDHTLVRWLALSDGEQLELECGEDIDTVASALNETDDATRHRLLEQIKLRKRTVTFSLRSSEALEALVNAIGNLTENPLHRLHFCFTTNATAARERLSSFDGGQRGILLWNRIRLGELPNEKVISAIGQLRDFLVLLARPKKIQVESWLRFIRFFREQPIGILAAFIRSFEWSMDQPDAEDLSNDVRNKLRERKPSESDIVDERYDRLFLFVFRLLSSPGPKRLTRADLENELSKTGWQDSDRVLLLRLRSHFEVLEGRVDEIEQSVNFIADDLKKLSAEHGIGKVQLAIAGMLATDAPAPVTTVTRRTQTVASLCRISESKTWLALFGLSDTGKTQLGLLVAQAKGPCRAWIRFRCDMSSEQAVTTLVESLRRVSELQTETVANLPSWYQQACSTFESQAVVVLDDLPNLTGMSELLQHLEMLFEACRTRGVFVISTSHHRLPSSLTRKADASMLEVPVPRFSPEETAEVMAAHGAPPSFLIEANITCVWALSSGHPLLVTLACRFLRARDWVLENDQVTALLRGDHAQDLTDEVLRRMSQTLSEPQREMLYRMTLATRDIEDGDALALAGVAEAIPRPKECIATLLGAWLQRDTDRTLMVSPLVKTVGEGNLAEQTLLGCHRVLGDSIARKQMTPWDATDAIRHFYAAREFGRAGATWLSLLEEFSRHEFSADLRSILTWLERESLPLEMHVRLRTGIRILQIRLLRKYRLSPDTAFTDLDRIVDEVDQQNIGVAESLCVAAVIFLAPIHFRRACGYFKQTLLRLREWQFPTTAPRAGVGKSQVELLWTLIVNIQDRADLEAWLSVFDSFTEEERATVTNSKDAALGSVVLADRVMAAEFPLPKTQQNWLRVGGEIQWFREQAAHRQLEYLEACCVRALVIVLGEELNDPDQALREVTHFWDREGISEISRGLVAGAVGKMLVVAERRADALPWLRQAVAAPDSGLPHDRIRSLVAAAKCTSMFDAEAAISYAAQAAQIGCSHPAVEELEAVKSLAEYAIALLSTVPSAESIRRAYPAWAEVIARLLDVKVRDHNWKDLWVLVAHCQSYLTSLALTGSPPDRTIEGEEFFVPFQGLFFNIHPQRNEYYREESIATVLWMFSRYAREAGDGDAAELWEHRAAEEIEGQPLTFYTSIIRRDDIPRLLLDNNFEAAFDWALRTQLANVAGMERVKQSGLPIDPSTVIDHLIHSVSDEGRKEAERSAMIVGVVPAIIRIAAVAITDRTAALALADEAAQLCRQIAVGVIGPTLWLRAAEIFDGVAREIPAKDRLCLGNWTERLDASPIQALGYLASAIGSTAETGFKAHVCTVKWLVTLFPSNSTAHSKLLLPYIESYWRTTFKESRFQFRTPAAIEGPLNAAFEAPAKVRVCAILKALLPAFDTQGLQPSVQWLRSVPTS